MPRQFLFAGIWGWKTTIGRGILSAVLVDDAYFHSLSDVSDVVVLRCYIEVIGSLGGPRNAVPSFHEIVGFGGTWCTLFRSW